MNKKKILSLFIICAALAFCLMPYVKAADFLLLTEKPILTDSEKLDAVLQSADMINSIAKDTSKIDDMLRRIDTANTKVGFFGTEYHAGENGTAWLQLLRDYLPINDATCYLTIYNPDKTKFLDNVLMFYLSGSDGIYYYDMAIPDATGVYMATASCYEPARAFTDDFLDYSNLEDWRNVTIQNGKVSLLSSPSEFPNYKVIEPTANMTGNVLLYHMNEVSGMIIDYSGEGNNGTDYEASYGVAGKINTALWFNGVNSVVSVVESSSWKPTDRVSVEAWVKFDEIKDAVGAIVGGYSSATGYFLAVNTYANTVYFYLNGVYYYYAVYGQGFSNNTWYHIVGTYDRYGGANNHKIYVNGQVIAQRTSSGAIGNYNLLMIGSSVGIYKFGKGTIDEVAIFNRSLTSAEVLDHYNRGVGFLTTDGFIQSKPINLDGAGWVDFSSSYVLNADNISFSILNAANNTICSSLGNISSCANTTTPVKLYARITRVSNVSVSPEINDWWISWIANTIEELRGAGELHVSPPANYVCSPVINTTVVSVINQTVEVNLTNQTNEYNYTYNYSYSTTNDYTNSYYYTYIYNYTQNVSIPNANITVNLTCPANITTAKEVWQYFNSMSVAEASSPAVAGITGSVVHALDALCVNDTHIRRYGNTNVCYGVDCFGVDVNRTELCQYGCDMQRNECRGSPLDAWIWVLVIFFVIMLFYGIWRMVL